MYSRKSNLWIWTELKPWDLRLEKTIEKKEKNETTGKKKKKRKIKKKIIHLFILVRVRCILGILLGCWRGCSCILQPTSRFFFLYRSWWSSFWVHFLSLFFLYTIMHCVLLGFYFVSVQLSKGIQNVSILLLRFSWLFLAMKRYRAMSFCFVLSAILCVFEWFLC